MKDLDVVEPAGGPWASPVVLIPKPDGSVRFCVDYRRLNAVTIKDSYALPRIDDSIDSLGGAQYFSTLDANSGYWQIAVSPNDQDKTTFTTHRGLFRFKRLPFGLVSAPATFQRALDVILSSVRFQCALTYLDDIIVYSTTFGQHLLDLHTVLSLLKAAGITLKLSKCKFAAPEVPYLGYIVGRAGLRVDTSKISALQAATPPTSKTGIRRFLGMCGVYRRFISGYSKVAVALTRYLKDGVPETFSLDDDALKSHSQLKNAITSAPVLALPNATGLYVLEADASASQLGVQLLQEQSDKSFRPIGFWSRQCNQAECNYSPTEREALAIVWGIRICRPYLEYTRFRIHSDHQALRWLFSVSISESNPRLVRWRLALSAYDFEVVYKPGPQQRVADELSRMYTTEYAPMPAVGDEEGTIPCILIQQEDLSFPPSPTVPRTAPFIKLTEPLEAIALEELTDAQARDTWCQDMLRVMEETICSPSIQEILWDDHGVLSCRKNLEENAPLRWLAPASLRERILTLGHFSPLAAHPGATRMYQNLARKWYWPSLSRDCSTFVRRCPTCAARHLKRGPRRSTPLTVFPPNGALEFISMDVLGPLPTSRRGNRYILVMTDRFSKLTVAVPMADQTASSVAQAFVDRWLACYGIPIVVLTDNGSNFASKFMAVVTQMLGIKHVYTSAYRPSTNGQVERFNATLADGLTILSANDKEWDQVVGITCHAYNGSVHSSTGYAPFELACTRAPAVAVWTTQPILSSPDRKEKPMFRQKLLERVQRQLQLQKRRIISG
jgi:transposase InsO family protein